MLSRLNWFWFWCTKSVLRLFPRFIFFYPSPFPFLRHLAQTGNIKRLNLSPHKRLFLFRWTPISISIQKAPKPHQNAPKNDPSPKRPTVHKPTKNKKHPANAHRQHPHPQPPAPPTYFPGRHTQHIAPYTTKAHHTHAPR